jgi:hypothetical protein
MKTSPLPDLNYLKECFEIDPSIPQGIRWKSQRPASHFKKLKAYKIWSARFAGKACGTLRFSDRSRREYYKLLVNYKEFFNHRIIYAIHNNTTDFNGKVIDHIDGNSLNNNPQNLRLVTMSENSLNSKKRENNNTGHKNIYFHKIHKLYVCSIKANGKKNWIGSYKTLEEALVARNSYIEKLKIELGDYFRI